MFDSACELDTVVVASVRGEATNRRGDLVSEKQSKDQNQASRRKFVKRAAYVTPVIVTLAVAPSYAKNGSEKPKPKLDK